MGKVNYKAIYAGHGALNYIEVKDSKDTVVKKIIIDAGSSSDYLIYPGSGRSVAADNEKALIEDVKKSSKDQVIICVTHVHTDHYSFISKMYQELKKAGCLHVIEKIYIGSVLNEIELLDTAKDLYNLAYDDFINSIYKFSVLGQKMKPETLWKWDDIELSVLFNCISGGKDINSNSANYVVVSRSKKAAIWFTGDSTGSTFSALGKWNIIDGFFTGCDILVMTAPHHGSIDTFMQDDFIYACDNTAGKTWHCEKWPGLCKKLGINNYRMVASFGGLDQHMHPSGYSMFVYAGLTPTETGHFSPKYAAFHKAALQEPVECSVCKIDESSYVQQFKDKPYVFVTCKYDGKEYDTVPVEIAL